MAYVIESLPLKGFRKAHLKQLAQLIIVDYEDGCYYGNQEQYYARAQDLLDVAEWLIAVANDPDAKLPR